MKHFTLFIYTFLLCGCIMEDQFDVPAKSSKVSDNLQSSESYYWFNGKQEPLHKIPEYSFVIAEETSAENLNAFVTS